MRLRNIRGSREVIGASDFVIHEPKECRGAWREVFGNENPIHIEIGMGKGRFLSELAALHPDINYVGIEKYSSVLLRAIEQGDEELIAASLQDRLHQPYRRRLIPEYDKVEALANQNGCR